MTKTIRDDLVGFRRKNSLGANEADAPIWMAQLGSFIMPLPNFKWRRGIIDRHDAHHLLTGYPPTPLGELSLAAWELGAGCFKAWPAKLLCGILALLGLLSQPKATISAFKTGRQQALAYQKLQDRDWLTMSLIDAHFFLELSLK